MRASLARDQDVVIDFKALQQARQGIVLMSCLSLISLGATRRLECALCSDLGQQSIHQSGL